MSERITQFNGEYHFLSNFYPSPIKVTGLGHYESYTVPTAEHAFQALKTRNPTEQQYVLDAPNPGSAKRSGRKVTLREDWEDIKHNVMRIVVTHKFEQNPDLATKLVDTDDAILIEGNHWGDRTWGATWDADKQYWVGINMLGRILMDVRSELRIQ